MKHHVSESLQPHSFQEFNPPALSSGLVILAEIASKQLKDTQETMPTSHNYKANVRDKFKPYKLKQSCKKEPAIKNYKMYIAKNVQTLTENKCAFQEQVRVLQQEALSALKLWPALTTEQQRNLHKNVRYMYAKEVIN